MQQDTKDRIKKMAYDYAEITGDNPEEMYFKMLNFFYNQPIFVRFPQEDELHEPLSGNLKKHFNSVRILGKLYK